MWRQLLTVSWLDNLFPAQLAEIYLVSFAWVLALFVLLHGALAFRRRAAGAPPPADADLPAARTARFVTPGLRAHGVRGHPRAHLRHPAPFGAHRLLDDALPRALAGGRESVAMNRQAEGWLVNCVDRRSGRRVVRTPGAFRPKVWTLPAVERGPDRPALVYYLELPGMDDEDELIGWRRLYRVGEALVHARRVRHRAARAAPARRRAFAAAVDLRYDRP